MPINSNFDHSLTTLVTVEIIPIFSDFRTNYAPRSILWNDWSLANSAGLAEPNGQAKVKGPKFTTGI